MKIFFIKSESFLTLYRQKRSTTFKAYKGSKDIVKTVWNQCSNLNFQKLREHFLCTKKCCSCIAVSNSLAGIPSSNPSLRTYHNKVKKWQIKNLQKRQESSWISSKISYFVFKDEERSYWFGTTLGWAITDRIYIFGWTNALNLTSATLSQCGYISQWIYTSQLWLGFS